MLVGETGVQGHFRITAARERKLTMFGDKIYMGSYLFRRSGYEGSQVRYEVFTGDVHGDTPPTRDELRVELTPK